MSTDKINAELFAKMFLAGAKNLEVKKEWINELNVFPVPDGDTGTNMTMTILSAVKEVTSLTDISMSALAKAISSGSLRGARGNSGVILSQLLRGLTRVIRDYDEIDVVTIASAMERAVDTAYKAVMKPKEGTILTVARDAAMKARALADESADTITLAEFLTEVVSCAQNTLERTPDMLPVLKEAGVVDSGGQGLVTILEGACDAFMGKEINLTFETPDKEKTSIKVTKKTEKEIKFGYCTEFIIILEHAASKEKLSALKEFLNAIGDSIVFVADDEMIKVHVHTNEPGRALTKALTFGSLSKIKIDNMREEHQEILFKNAEKLSSKQNNINNNPKKEVGFVAVSAGDGFADIFRGLGVDYLIEGGQTMNPSTEDVLDAVRQVPAKNIFIYPNNKNIILAANQASHLCNDKNLIVIPTTTIPQGITAIINYVVDKSVEENTKEMESVIHSVKTGQITFAVRDTNIDGREIHKGDIMGLSDKGILSVGSDISTVAKECIINMMEGDSELISIYYGKDFSKNKAEKIAAWAEKEYPDCDVEVNAGGQPVYYCILSVE
ncbi:DAK2 domain-containing protein [Blautia liquoris]|nr:DAK2 domain-containing protein [Blautia liquoris]